MLFAIALAIVAVAETPLSIPRIITASNATTSSNVTSAFLYQPQNYVVMPL